MPGRLRNCSSSHHGHISGFSFGIKHTSRLSPQLFPGLERGGHSTLHPKLGATRRVPRAVAPQSQCLSCLSFPKSPLTPAQTPPSPAPLLLLPEPLERHPWVWRGLIPSILQSFSHQELCCRALGVGASPSSLGMCSGTAEVEVLGPSHGEQRAQLGALAMGKLVLMASLAPSSFLTQGWRGCRGWTVGQIPQHPRAFCWKPSLFAPPRPVQQ